VDGVVLSIDAAGLSDVRGFTLRTVAGEVLTFKIGVTQNPTEFPPGHLGEHKASAAPVRVYFTAEAGELTAYRLEDAAATGASPQAS
jgi:hypothetical protein